MADLVDDALNGIYHAVTRATLPVVMDWMWETLARCQPGASSRRYGKRATDPAAGSAWAAMVTERTAEACYAALAADSSVSRMAAARHAAHTIEALEAHEPGKCPYACSPDAVAGQATYSAINAVRHAVAALAYRHPDFTKGPGALATATRKVWADVDPARVLALITGEEVSHG